MYCNATEPYNFAVVITAQYTIQFFYHLVTVSSRIVTEDGYCTIAETYDSFNNIG